LQNSILTLAAELPKKKYNNNWRQIYSGSFGCWKWQHFLFRWHMLFRRKQWLEAESEWKRKRQLGELIFRDRSGKRIVFFRATNWKLGNKTLRVGCHDWKMWTS